MWEKLLSVLLLAPEVAPPEVLKTLTFLPVPVSVVIVYSQLPSALTSLCVSSLGGKLTFTHDVSSVSNCLAYGSFQETIEETGWNRLSVQFDGSVESSYAAGLVEGLLMTEAIEAHIANMKQVYSYGNLQELYRYYGEVDEVVVDLIRSEENDEFWDVIRSTRAQLEGILDGAALLGLTLTIEDLYFINTDGDIDNLFMLTSDPFTSFSHSYLSNLARSDRCSALIKLTPNDIFVGHTTMEDYGEMNRVLKTYQVSGVTIRMSSYPGAVSSTDDFLLSSRGLAVMETSLPLAEGVMKGGKSGLPAFYRIQAGIRTATNPVEFIEAMKKHDSFTYSSQWMILDYNRAEERPLQQAFYVLETAPKYFQYRDFSSYLEENSYWASYNLPYFPETFPAIGLSQHSTDIREEQFSILQNNIKSVEDMMAVMQSNPWKSGKCEKGNALQPCSPEEAISPRFDLSKSGTLFGGTDSKVTSRELMAKIAFLAISGPTHQSQPLFSFPSPSPFLYLPNTWSFDWVLYPPNVL